MYWLGPDVIDRLDGLVGRWTHGPMHRFTFRADGGFAGIEVEHLLRQYGIRVWGREMDDPDERALLVKQSQAVWAEYILCRAGVPLTCALLDPRNAVYQQRHAPNAMPIPWTERGIGPISIIDHVVDWIDRLAGGRR